MTAADDRERLSKSTSIGDSPAELRLPHVGTYRRSLPVSVERLYENAIDWEHLPYLHRSTFSRVECLEAGEWGFRARVWQRFQGDRGPFVIELRLDRECHRWITQTVEGPGRGSEIWTHAFATGARSTDIVVDFFVLGATNRRVAELREFYTTLYARLYDEDVRMMTLRQARLDEARQSRAPSDPAARTLGPLGEVRKRLPIMVKMGGQTFRIVEVDGQLIAHAVVCPHMLGPLEQAEVRDGIIECPWHGYRFDVRSRVCVNGAGKLASPLAVRIDQHTSQVIIEPG